MPKDDQPSRPPGASRARTGGSARPLDGDAARPPRVASSPASRHDRATGSPAGAAPSAVPPSINPAGANRRPAVDDAIAVGRPTRPTAPQRPAVQQQSTAPARSTRPPGPARPGQAGVAARPPVAPPTVSRRPGSRRKRVALIAAAVVVLLLAWPIGMLIWANGKIEHIEALSGAANTPGTTYLIAGSDSRADGVIEDSETPGARTDTIMLLQVPPSGPSALISLPRDTYVEIPGHGPGKLNASFSIGGAPLLIQTVEQLSGIHVDHYAEIGFGGVEHVVDAVGGIELCLDDPVLTYPLFDANSGLSWDAPGCKVVDGVNALAFARMRYADPTGDIGRAKRQQQLIGAVVSAVAKPSLAFQPTKQVALTTAGLGALAVSDGTNILDLGRMALAFRSATGPEGIKGTPPILDPDYRPGGVGSTVQLDPESTPGFFTAIVNGTLPPGPVGGMPVA